MCLLMWQIYFILNGLWVGEFRMKKLSSILKPQQNKFLDMLKINEYIVRTKEVKR